MLRIFLVHEIIEAFTDHWFCTCSAWAVRTHFPILWKTSLPINTRAMATHAGRSGDQNYDISPFSQASFISFGHDFIHNHL
jgi:hypothetical protein